MKEITLPKELPVMLNTAALEPTFLAIYKQEKERCDEISLSAKNLFKMKISASQSQRCIKLIKQIASCLSTFDIFFSIDNDELVMKRGNQSMNLSIFEKKRRRVKPINPKNLKTKILFERFNDEYEWTGILVLTDNGSSFSSLQWKDGKRQSLESKVEKVAIDINEQFNLLLQHSLERLEQKKIAEIRQLQKAENKQQEKRRVKRYEFLKQIFERTKQISNIGETRKAISDIFGGHMSKRFRQIDRWLEGEAKRIKSQNSLKAICSQLDSNGLFDDIKL